VRPEIINLAHRFLAVHTDDHGQTPPDFASVQAEATLYFTAVRPKCIGQSSLPCLAVFGAGNQYNGENNPKTTT
jgi:hypothetical protein